MRPIVKIRVPARNIKSEDILYHIPEPVALLSNNNDDTTSKCTCLGDTKIKVMLASTEKNSMKLPKDHRKLNPEKMISFQDDKQNIYLTPIGGETIRQLLQPSNNSKLMNSSEIKGKFRIDRGKLYLPSK